MSSHVALGTAICRPRSASSCTNRSNRLPKKIKPDKNKAGKSAGGGGSESITSNVRRAPHHAVAIAYAVAVTTAVRVASSSAACASVVIVAISAACCCYYMARSLFARRKCPHRCRSRCGATNGHISPQVGQSLRYTLRRGALDSLVVASLSLKPRVGGIVPCRVAMSLHGPTPGPHSPPPARGTQTSPR